MARTIVSAKDVDSGAAPQRDNFGARLVKYIPAEVVTLYLTLDSVMKAAAKEDGTVAGMDRPTVQVIKWVIFGLLLAGTPVYLMRVANISKQTQVIIATISFAVWVFAVGSGGPFAALFGPDHQHQQAREFFAALLLPVYTFAVPLIEAEN